MREEPTPFALAIKQYEVMTNEVVRASTKKITKGVLGDTKLVLFNDDRTEVVSPEAQSAMMLLKEQVKRRYTREAERAIDRM